MKRKLLFYCQHILGIGHLVRSMEIVRGLLSDFQICFLNGGEIVDGFQVPDGIELINLPAIKTDAEFRTLEAVDPAYTLESVQELRTTQILEAFHQFQPDIVLVELFPFGRRRFSFELIPLMEAAKVEGAKVVCSLRDIVVTKQDQTRHEEKVCRLINQYFDLVLVHGDRQFVALEESFGRVEDLQCPVHYTGYVVQPLPPVSPAFASSTIVPTPLILVSIGGGRFGHELIEGVVAAAPELNRTIPHHIQIFTGPFFPEEQFQELQAIAPHHPNLSVERYTPELLTYMRQADLSISMSGYNTTMNILTTGVRALLLPFTGNDDQEQTIRAGKLDRMGIVTLLHPDDLNPSHFTSKITTCLQQKPTPQQFDLNGVENTAMYLRQLCQTADSEVSLSRAIALTH